MIFGKLSLGDFGILMSNMSQVQTIFFISENRFWARKQGSLSFPKFEFFIKAHIGVLSFFIRWPYAVFYKMQVVFYKSAHFMYL